MNHHLQTPSHQSIPVAPIVTEPNIQWVACGALYLILVVLSNHPEIIKHFPHGSMSSLLCVWPMVGVAYMLRDGVQYLYENTPEKKAKSSGFLPSMLFVLGGVLVTLYFADPEAKVAGATAYGIASIMDGMVFSLSKKRSLAYRLLISNIVGAIFDSSIFIGIMVWQNHMGINGLDAVLTTFMEISPALVIFLLSSTMLSKAFGVLNQTIVKKIRP